MEPTDVKIIDTFPSDNEQLKKALGEGFKIIHIVPYITTWSESKTKYAPNGNSYTESEVRENHMVKYILERDGISRNLYG